MKASQRAGEFLGKKSVQVAAVVDPFFGDNGKGKIVDLLGAWADVTIRGTGGANAGHTIVIGDAKYVFHLLPSSISRDGEGKASVIGRGTVVNPGSLSTELAALDVAGLSSNGLRVSQDAQLVLPTHIILDHLLEAQAGAGKIGTTKQGVGPAYSAHRARLGVRVNDLLNPDALSTNIRKSVDDALLRLRGADPDVARAAIGAVEGGAFFHEKALIDTDALIAWVREKATRFQDQIADTDALAHEALAAGKKILLEGAQGVLLSVDYGTYPFVTSSDCSLSGLALGSGLRTEDVGYTASIVKAYATRVGEGPFPTELSGDIADKLRAGGNEYGATTKRPRRVGWLDLPLMRYGLRYSSATLTLTKADVLSGYDSVSVCTAYTYQGPDYRIGAHTLKKGDVLTAVPPYPDVLQHCVPVYTEMPGWGALDVSMDTKEKLPPTLQAFIARVEAELSSTVDILSIGADRDDTVIF